MKIILSLMLTLFGLVGPTTSAQSDDGLLIDGANPLTKSMVNKLATYYGVLLNLKLEGVLREQFQQQVMAVWQHDDFKKMGFLMTLFEEGAQLARLSEDEQLQAQARKQEPLLVALRQEASHPFNAFLLAAYDQAPKTARSPDCPMPKRLASPTSSFYRILKIGHYDGELTNTTLGLQGKAGLDITNIDSSSGKINATFIAYAGLEGEGSFSGLLDESGKLFLSGEIPGFKGCMQAVVALDSTLSASIRWQGKTVLKDEARLRYQGAGLGNQALRQTSYPNSLVGKYEFNDRIAQERATYTSPAHNTTYSKKWTIEFFEGSRYKLIQTEMLCPAGRTCCRTNGVQEEGVFSIQGESISFSFKSGSQLHMDQCDPKQSATQALRASAAMLQGTFKWALGPNPTTNVLTFCHQKDGKTVCYERTR